MKRTTLILLVFVPLVMGSLIGCERTIQLDLDQVPGRIVIEGLLTDVPDRQYVRVTRSGDFYQQGNTTRIDNAVVQITDDLGEQISFQHNPRGHEDSVGYYLPPAGYAGQTDRTYALSVLVDGKSYEASDKLLRVTRIDSLTYRPNVFAQRDPPADGKLYELLIYAKEPQDTKDYYFIQYYRNDSLTFNGETDVYFADDYGVGEDINGIPSNIRFAVGDTGRVEMYSLSRKGFLYYSDLVTILNSDGGMFSPPPANPRSNLTGGALGFFQVSAMSSKETVIQE